MRYHSNAGKQIQGYLEEIMDVALEKKEDTDMYQKYRLLPNVSVLPYATVIHWACRTPPEVIPTSQPRLKLTHS